jgi:radical SAM superfamily enzyme YgiQ (UPF0313 family)
VKPVGPSGLAFALNIIPLGLESIAAYIRDLVTDILIFDQSMDKEPFRKVLSKFKPDLVGFSMSATEHNSGANLMKIVKNFDLKIPIIAGGFHPTGAPEIVLKSLECDAVCRGEGESLMREFVQGKRWNLIDGLSYKNPHNKNEIIHNKDRDFIKDLDSLPFPARDLRKKRGYHYKHALLLNREYDLTDFSRGCYGQCTFCCEPYYSRGIQRYRSPERMMESILDIWKFHKRKPLRLLISDPHIMGQYRKVDQLSDLLIEADLDITFQIMSRTETIVKQPSTVEKMIQAGMISWELGIESPIQDDLDLTSKHIPVKIQSKAVDIIRQLGGETLGTFVIGLPNHTRESIKQFPKYAREIGVSSAAFGIAAPFPGTPFWDDLYSQGLIFEQNWAKFDENNSVFHHPLLSPQDIENLRNWCMAKFWNFDTILEQIHLEKKRVGKFRFKQKVNINEFILMVSKKLKFATNVATELAEKGQNSQKDNYLNSARMMFDAWTDPRIEQYFQENPMYNIIDMRQFGKIFGGKRLQVIVEDTERKTCLIAILITIRKEGIKTIKVSKKPSLNYDFLLRTDVNCLYVDPTLSKIARGKTILQFLSQGNLQIKGLGILLKMVIYGIKETISLYLNKKSLVSF